MWQALGFESSGECHASRKSIVRKIGSYFPLKRQARIKVQLGSNHKKLARSLDSELNNVGLESLSEENDVGLVSWLKTPRRMMASAANLFNLDNIAEHHETDSGHSSEVDEQEDNVFSANEPGEQGDEKTRIRALEDELARLKAQMARLSLEQIEKSESRVPAAPPPPAAPVAPPPPLLTVSHDQEFKTPVRKPTTASCDDERPNMSFLLKEMSTVKLRSVARSPGGTPLKTRLQNTTVPVDNDPAAIIAHALQRKFSHSVFRDSPDKENSSPGTSFTTVTSPLSL